MPTAPSPRLDVVGLALLAPAVVALLFALSKAALDGFGAPTVLIPLVIGVVLALSWLGYSRRTTNPIVDLTLLRTRTIGGPIVVLTLVGTAVFATLFLVPILAQVGRNAGVLAAGAMLIPFGVGAGVAMLQVERGIGLLGARTLAVTGALITGATAAALSTVSLTASPWTLVPLILVIGVGLGLVAPTAVTSLYQAVPPDRFSAGTTTMYLFNQIGAAVGVAFISILAQNLGDDPRRALWWVTGAMIAVIVVAPVLLPSRASRSETISPG